METRKTEKLRLIILIVLGVFLCGCSNDDDDNLQTNLTGTVENYSRCSGIYYVDVDGRGLIATTLTSKHNNKGTRITFDMVKDDFPIVPCAPPWPVLAEYYELSNISLVSN